MASSTPLKDLEENFFMCSVCLDQFKEPKLLPCLHRYCKDCLKTIIQSSQDGTIKCPMCKEKYVIPENGVDDFKTDFHMKSVIEFIQLEQSLEKKELKKCIDCSKKTTVTAYCFKCKNFLCDPCFHRHLNNSMFNEHKGHILNLENIEAKNLTLEKLAALTEDPRCHIHIKQSAQLCCSTCGNVPVCLTCVYGMHEGHTLHDVTKIAKSERELLQPKLDEINIHKIKLYELPEKVKATKRKLKHNLAKETEKLRIQYEQQVNKVKAKLDENTAEQEIQDTDIEYRIKYEENEINIKREEEIDLVREKYDGIMKTMKGKYIKKSKEFKKKHDEMKKELSLKFGSLEGNLKNMTTAQEVLAEQNENKLQEILDHCERIIKRYENFTATTLSILACKDEWTDAQCIPDFRAASEPLINEMKKKFPELESLSDLDISGLTKVIIDDVMLTEKAESVVDIEGIKTKGWSIGSMTSTRDGCIVITGRISDDYSHITVINRKGEIQRQDKIKTEENNVFTTPYRYCCFLSEFKVATVCAEDEIGIYHIRNGSYNKKNISDVTSRWPQGRRVCCVATDPVNNHIIVGTNSRYVYVFDYQLNYSHTITLPSVVHYSGDITVHGCSLLICDDINGACHAVTMEGSESKLMYTFTKPDIDGYNWRHISVCTDKNGFIYILWSACISGQWRHILVQYSQDGRQLLKTRIIDNDSYCVTTLEAENAEKLMIVTRDSGKLYTYGLVVT